jgi:outer membrane protein TolC
MFHVTRPAHHTVGWLAVSWLWAGVALAQAAAPTDVPPPESVPVDAAAQPVLADEDPSRTRTAILEALAQGNEPLDANRAAELARATSPSLRSARAATARARAAASQAFVAVYPRLDTAFNYKRRQNRGATDLPYTNTIEDPTGGPDIVMQGSFAFEPPPLDTFAFQIDLTYGLSDLFLTILPRYRAAKKAGEYQDMIAGAQQHDVALAAREAYYEYARSRAFAVVARDGLANAEAHRADVEKLVNAGVQARVELMRADARVASQRVAVNVTDRNEAVARTALLSLLHLPSDRQPIVKEDFSATEPALPQGVDQYVEQAYQARTELKALDKLVSSYLQTKQAQFGGKLPKLGVGATFYITTRDQMNNINAIGRGAWEVMASLSWSPNDYAVNGYAMNQTLADIERAQADMQSFRDRVRLEVTQAWEAHESGRLAEESARAGVVAAEESYRVRREQYKAGAAVGTEVNDAETELRRAQLELVAAVVDIKLARVRLDRALER